MATLWEVVIKTGLGKLDVAALPHVHRDPFDRLLVAQARVEGLTLVTADLQVRAYPVVTLAADTA